MRSLNGKGLDVRLKLPHGFEELDIPSRKLIGTRLTRGNLQVNLQVTSSHSGLQPRVDEALAIALMDKAIGLQGKLGGDLPTLADIMAMRGVIEFEEPSADEEIRQARNQSLLDSLNDTLILLVEMRKDEGSAILKVLTGQLAGIEQLVIAIRDNEARSPEAVREHFKDLVSKVLENEEGFDPQRLHQEAVVIAAKADIQEELDRLIVHLHSARELLGGNGPIGRKLDFLAQEFNRECNTICSKSNSAEVTALGLDMKLVIDQFREQVQNME